MMTRFTRQMQRFGRPGVWLVLAGMACITLFQNCSPAGFSAVDTSVSMSDTVPSDFWFSAATPIGSNPDFAGHAWSQSPSEFKSMPPQTNDGGMELFASRIAASKDGFVAVTSACGTFFSNNDGQNFSAIARSGVDGAVLSVEIDSGKIYLGTTYGLYVSADQGDSFQALVTSDKIQSWLAQKLIQFPCGKVSPGGPTFQVRQISARGSRIFIYSDLGLLVSNDSGQTFQNPKISHEGYSVGPLFEITSIQQNGNQVVAGVNPNAKVSSVSVPTNGTSGACAVRSTGWSTDAIGMMVSNDGGTNFTTVPLTTSPQNPSEYDMQHMFQFRRDGSVMQMIVGYGFARTSLYYSNDSGATLVRASIAGQTASGYSVNYEGGVVGLGGKVFSVLHSGSAEYDKLLISSDDGKSYQALVVDPSVTARFVITSVRATADKLIIATNRGVYLSADLGQHFTHKSYSSNYCTYPWWKKNAFATGIGKTLLVKSSGDQGDMNGVEWIRSDNGGKTFYENKISYESIKMRSFSINDSVNIGDAAYLTDLRGGLIRYTPGLELYEPLGASGGVDSKTNTRITALSSQKLLGIEGFYIDVGQTKMLSQLTPQQLEMVENAYSDKDTLVVGVRLEGFFVIRNGSIISSVPDTSVVRKVVRLIGDRVFLYSDRLWASKDGNTTFQVVPGSPRLPRSVFKYGNLIYALDTIGGIYLSSDGGDSFQEWTGLLN